MLMVDYSFVFGGNQPAVMVTQGALSLASVKLTRKVLPLELVLAPSSLTRTA